MSKNQILLNTYNADEALRVGDFTLMPVNPKPPIITSHPIRNIIQTTHGTPVFDPSNPYNTALPLDYTPLIPVFNKFTIRKGTAIQWTMFLLDPSNTNNPNDISNLKYVWKKNGNPLFALNRLNNGRGAKSVVFTEKEVTGELSGEYICEVSNQYGTTTTIPFTLDILDIDNHGSIYSNLINNGDGDGGLDSWIDQGGQFRTVMASKDSFVGSDSTIAEFQASTGSLQLTPYPFRFGILSPSNLFYPIFYKLIKANPNITDLTTLMETDTNGVPKGLADWEWWKATTIVPSVIGNEDINVFSSPQGFFPGPDWIDKYNKNSKAKAQKQYKTLLDEMDVNKTNTSYFTRNVLQFGDSSEVTLEQSVNVVNISPIIDGQVAGIDRLTGHFFAYVGIGISRYRVRYTYKGRPRSVNWYVKDLISFRRALQGDINSSARITPDKGTPIEIEPLADDTIKIELTFLDSVGQSLATAEAITPTVQDIWAVKEKVFFPLLLYPIFVFFNDNDNPITVFNTQYTTTTALKPLIKNEITDVAGYQAELTSVEDDIARLGREITSLSDLISEAQKQITDAQELQRKADADKDSGITQEELAAAKVFIDQNPPKITTWQQGIETRSTEQSDLRVRLKNLQNSGGIFYGKSAMHPDQISKTPLTVGLDKNAAFLISRYGKGLLNNHKIYPEDIWEPVYDDYGTKYYENLLKGCEGSKYKALQDLGASAFFAVQDTTVLPAGTRLVRVKITAKNSLDYLEKGDPAPLGWNKSTLYNTLYNIDESKDNLTRNPFYDYKDPRCGITKIKYQLIPNNELISENHITYQIPPQEYTVLGLARNAMLTDAVDTTKPGPFTYNLYIPQLPETAPKPVQNKTTENQEIEQYETIVKGPNILQPNSQNPTPTKVQTQTK